MILREINGEKAFQNAKYQCRYYDKCIEKLKKILRICQSFTEQTADELKLQREEKKRYLLRKLSFRPSVDELKNRKVN